MRQAQPLRCWSVGCPAGTDSEHSNSEILSDDKHGWQDSNTGGSESVPAGGQGKAFPEQVMLKLRCDRAGRART